MRGGIVVPGISAARRSAQDGPVGAERDARGCLTTRYHWYQVSDFTHFDVSAAPLFCTLCTRCAAESWCPASPRQSLAAAPRLAAAQVWLQPRVWLRPASGMRLAAGCGPRLAAAQVWLRLKSGCGSHLDAAPAPGSRPKGRRRAERPSPRRCSGPRGIGPSDRVLGLPAGGWYQPYRVVRSSPPPGGAPAGMGPPATGFSESHQAPRTIVPPAKNGQPPTARNDGLGTNRTEWSGAPRRPAEHPLHTGSAPLCRAGRTWRARPESSGATLRGACDASTATWLPLG